MDSEKETDIINTGRVKWFNIKAGYGFATITDGPESGTDVFVHHSSIQVKKEQYRYLVQGEYVQFYLTMMEEGPHKYQTRDVVGVGGGPLMCETLLETGKQIRSIRPRYESEHDHDHSHSHSHSHRHECGRNSSSKGRGSGRGPSSAPASAPAS
jgi:cold shock CspA family protein